MEFARLTSRERAFQAKGTAPEKPQSTERFECSGREVEERRVQRTKTGTEGGGRWAMFQVLML